MKTSCLILAAGLGQRMGQNKALVRYRGQTFLEAVAGLIAASNVASETIVVTGADRKNVEELAGRLRLKAVYNEDFKSGLMRSLQTGIRNLAADTDLVLVHLVDQPLLLPETLSNFLSFYKANSQTPGTLARLYHQGRPGHPCLIPRRYFAEILTQPATDSGAAFLFKKYSDTILRYEANDPGVTLDFDLPEDLSLGNKV